MVFARHSLARTFTAARTIARPAAGAGAAGRRPAFALGGSRRGYAEQKGEEAKSASDMPW
jgi:hypothetical protein